MKENAIQSFSLNTLSIATVFGVKDKQNKLDFISSCSGWSQPYRMMSRKVLPAKEDYFNTC
jgi:hypothetical protein